MTLAGPSTLELSRELVAPTLRRLVDRLDPLTRLVVSYHFGWCDRYGAALDANGGKAIRSGLTILAAEAAGAAPESAVAGAAAVELMHNYSLVHDDVMDRDDRRRHRPTVWALWGEATAILAGDAMLSLAYEALLECAVADAHAAHAVLATASRDLIRGQHADLAFETRLGVTVAECLEMAWYKTGSLMAASTETGALLAEAPAPVRAALRAYGANLGMAFQLVDDLLGIWGDPARTGKPVYSDLRSAKKTLPVTWTIECGGCWGRELATWLVDREHAAVATDGELREIADLVERGGGRAWAGDEADRRTAQAAQAVDSAEMAPAPAGELIELTRYLATRQV